MKKAILIILLSPIYMFLEGIWERITKKDDDVEDYMGLRKIRLKKLKFNQNTN